MERAARPSKILREANRVALLPEKAADTFFLHGGLEYVPTDELLSTFGSINREFKKQARCEFNRRLRQCHPSLVAAVGPSNIDSIGWKEWCRFELGERKSRKCGDSWQVQASDLTDIDVLLEVKKNDGSLVWHGCMPLQRGDWRDRQRRYRECPETIFILPHICFDAPKPGADDYQSFESPDPYFPNLTMYHYWCGRRDCSLQQKTICKAIHGINTKPLLHVQVVLRSRSNGKMVTLMSAKRPNQIIGEDYNNDVGDYELCYCNRYRMFDEDDRLDASIKFSLYSPQKLDKTQHSVQFGTSLEDRESESDDHTNEEEETDSDASGSESDESGFSEAFSDSESNEPTDEEEEADNEDNGSESRESESEDHTNMEEEGATVEFRFEICDEDNYEDSEGLVLEAMRFWKWG